MMCMSDETATETEAAIDAPPAPKRAVVDAVRKYVAAEDGESKAILQPVGAMGVRITLVGEKNGLLGDAMVPSLTQARAVVDEVEGLEIAPEWDRELTNKVTISPSHWRKMAGWVAHQTRFFPRARNRRVVDYIN